MSFVFYLIRYEFKKPEQQLNKKGSILYNALNVAKMMTFCSPKSIFEELGIEDKPLSCYDCSTVIF